MPRILAHAMSGSLGGRDRLLEDAVLQYTVQHALDALHTAWFIGNAPDFLIRRWFVFADYNLANERRLTVDDVLCDGAV